MALPESIYSAEQSRQLDRLAIEQHDIPGTTLMERAGQAAYALLRSRWSKARNILIYCGAGNNAGDGYVLARLLHKAGINVVVIAVAETTHLGGDALNAYQLCRETGVNIEEFSGNDIPNCQLVVDALFGTGLDRPVSGPTQQAIRIINSRKSGLPVLSLDVPSGLHADFGTPLAEAVQATATITFVSVKTGLLTGQGMDYCGELFFDDLFVPEEVYQAIPAVALRLTRSKMLAQIPKRKGSMHKGQAGHAIILGGDMHMGGAALMAGEAAYRCGAGLVSLGTHESHSDCLHSSCPELIVYGVASLHSAKEIVEKGDVVAIGPGLGGDAWGRYLFHATIDLPYPFVVDADGLKLLAKNPRKRDDWILTPHPGEAARLLSIDTAAVQGDRLHAVREIAQTYGGVCVLKGAGTLIAAHGHQQLYLCNYGNPGMATAGMGDILTGVIVGLLAQGLTPLDAARVGVWLHAYAGDQVKAKHGETGMLATDLLPELRRASNGLV